MSTTETIKADRNLLLKAAARLDRDIISADYIISGAANHIFRIKTKEKSLILKLSKIDEPRLFECESSALNHLKKTETIPVPEVIAVDDKFLILEDLGVENKSPGDKDWFELGRNMGRLHGVGGSYFGYDYNNFLGIWEQVNTAQEDWLDFYCQNRVLCYLDGGANARLLTADDRRGIEKIVSRIGDLIPNPSPCLCHGDFWRNNVYMTEGSDFYAIDPAIHYGFHEADLVMTCMYEPFPESFFEGYRETHELERDWQNRLPLYQLKELILMIAQFEDKKSIETLKSLIKRYV